MKAKVEVRLKKTVLDPQGKTVKKAIDALGFKGVSDVRMGKLIELKINSSDKTKVKADIEEMSKKLLSNPIIEEFSYSIEEE